MVSVSLGIDSIIACIMIWSVRDQSSHHPLLSSYIHSQLTKTVIRSKRLKSKVTHLIHLIIGTGALTGMLFSLSQSIVMFKRVQSAVINHTSVILFAQGSPVAYGPSIVLSKVYANSMMVFLNDRILSDRSRDGQTMPERANVTVPLSSIHFATTIGPADTAQVTSFGGSESTRSSMSGRTTNEDPSKQNIPA